MDMPVSTYAMLFPAVSLLFLAYTNRFLHLSELIRKLHSDWVQNHDTLLVKQISNLQKRLVLIRWMQFLGALSLTSSVSGMIVRIVGQQTPGAILFVIALVFMLASLVFLAREIWISGGSLGVVLTAMQDALQEEKQK